MSEPTQDYRGGLLYGLIAYGIWGIVPIYFNAIVELTDRHIGADEILAQRIIWSVAFLVVLLTLSRRWSQVAMCFRVPALRYLFFASSILIGINWFVYIHGVATNRIVQTSLGYFINPLVNVLLGMIFFRERLRFLQWIAVGLAAVGVIDMTLSVGELPWIALSLAASFGFYGLLRKRSPVDGLVGMSVETFLLVPLAGAYLLYLMSEDRASLGNFGPTCDILILVSGVVTALPLICFGQAARRLPLSTMGFMQFLSPSLQFVCAVVVIGEPLKASELVSFYWIWSGVAVFAVDALWRNK